MRPILFATDGSPTAEAATETAIELARLYDVPLIVLTAWDLGYLPTGPMPMAVADLDRVAKEQAEEVLEKATERAYDSGVLVETMLRHGEPIREITGAAKRTGARMIVLGSHGWGPVKRLLFGSVSTGVLHRAPCPVLVVPPPAPAAVHDRDSDRVAVTV